MECYLEWAQDTLALRAAVAHCKAVNLFKDSEAKIITAAEHDQMITDGLLDPDRKYSKIEGDQIGVIAKSYYTSQWHSTWEIVSCCKNDFLAGWAACEKIYQYDRDWDAAIEFNDRIKDWFKPKSRSFSFDTTGCNAIYWDVDKFPSLYPLCKHAVYKERRNGSSEVNIDTFKCTGEELEQLYRDIAYQNRTWNVVAKSLGWNPKLELDRWWTAPIA